ncbi:hypothetical protein BJL95_07525 [Methylomonas sp. LWB]|nr:hypothetical protein BJL95_07525 [Methylomonas sp. LWB]
MGLAKDLKEFGYQVYFTGTKKSEKLVKLNGFEFIPLFENWFINDEVELDSNESLNFLERLKSDRNIVNHIKKFISALIETEDRQFFDLIDQIKPELILVVATHYDSFIWGLLSYKSGVKTVYLHDTLCGSFMSGAPPITTGIIPNNSALNKIKIYFSWGVYFAQRGFQDMFYGRCIKSRLGFKYGIDKLCEHYGYPISMVDTSTDMLAPKLTFPEMVLCAREFDFGSEDSRRYYIGASVHIGRDEPGFPWNMLPEGKKLVYCSLGSLEYLSREKRIRFFGIVLAVAAGYQHYSWVIALGNGLSVNEFKSVPTNVVLVNYAPQISLLKKADIMITHGGTNSIRECIKFGVPMIAFPLGFDQRGNVARVVCHGIGVCGNIKNISVGNLNDLVQTVMNNTFYHIQMRLMKKRFENIDNEKLGLRLINSILGISEMGVS